MVLDPAARDREQFGPDRGRVLDPNAIWNRKHFKTKEIAMRVMTNAQRVSALLIAVTFVTGASAQQFVYPAKGQSPEQQKKDEAQCHTWAVGQSKYDPTKPPPATAAAQPPTTATGTAPGAGVRGAARGAVVGGAMGDAGAGAAAGAVAARGQSRRQNAAKAEQQQQAASQQQGAGMASYQKARGACLEGRGYSVK
jgi:hypothetical protein